jgi:carboxypeptidase Q
MINLRRTLPIIIAVLTVSAPLAQVTDRPDRSVIARITEEATRRSRLMETAFYLTDVYGPRLTGSPHLRPAGDFFIQRLKDWGVTNARPERWGPFGPGWTTDRFIALAVSPTPFPLAAYPKAWTPGTEGEVVADAVLAVIEKDADFATYRGKLRGLFVLTAPITDSSSQPAVAAPSPRYSTDDLKALAQVDHAVREGRGASRTEMEFTRKRMEFFINEGVAALIEPGGEGGAVVVGDGRLRDDAAFGGKGFYPWPDAVAAQVVLATEQYNRIARMLVQHIPVSLEMNIVNSYHPADYDSFNIIAELPGSDLASEVVMLGAHFDSWHGATGATDNAAGCAVMLEAMRILQATGLKTRRTVRLALWTGAEQGYLGSRGYVTEHFADPATMKLRPEHAGLSAYFNLDRGTGAIRGLYLQGNEAAAPVLESLLAPFKDQGVTALSPRSTIDGDHLGFDAVGLPAFDFIQDPLDYRSTRHSTLDTYERLRPADLIQNAIIVAALAYHTANRDERLPRKPLPAPDVNAAGPWSPGR